MQLIIDKKKTQLPQMEHWKKAHKHFPVQTSNRSKLRDIIDKALEIDKMYASQQKHSFAATFGTAPRHMDKHKIVL